MSILATIAVGLFLAFLTLVIIEGLASYVLVFRQRGTVLWATARKRSTHDPDLGWVNRPNTNIPDMYGPGVYLRINSQGFRNNHDFDRGVAQGRLRIICSGDSFTFAEGVDNDHTFCQLLASLDPRFETINMGQTGYGIDQAYLWYKRDGLKFSHQVYLLSFITDDFYRMQTAFFAGYAKPVLDVQDGKLVVTNVPVPRRSHYLVWIDRHLRSLNQLRTVELLTKAFRRISVNSAVESGSPEARNKKAREILRKLFEDLKGLREERSILPCLVYLPSPNELKGDDPKEWMEFMKSESQAFGIPLFDVLSDFRRLPVHESVRMFIRDDQPSPNHLTEEGNLLVAMMIYEKLKSHPSVAIASLE